MQLDLTKLKTQRSPPLPADLCGYLSRWFGCHQSQSHLGHRPGCPESANAVVWPPSPALPGGDPESPSLWSPEKSEHNFFLYKLKRIPVGVDLSKRSGRFLP